MGFLVGRSLFVEGYFARILYRSLHLMHEAALYGSGRAWLRSLARIFRSLPSRQLSCTDDLNPTPMAGMGLVLIPAPISRVS